MKSRIIVITIILAVVTACSSTGGPSCIDIVPPEIKLTGEKTILEKQIIGDYEELEKDAWVISTVQNNVQRSEGETFQTSGDPVMFKAMKIREYHSEKIRVYKNEGAIGEANTGYLKYLRTDKYEKDPPEKKILFTVIAEENKVRRIIFIRSLILSGVEKPTEKQIADMGRAFYEDQVESAQKNDKIQEKNGKWTVKK